MTDPSWPQTPAADTNTREAQTRADAQRAEENAHAAEAIHTDPALHRAGADTLQEEAEQDGRLRVQWVRPTDLAARAGARVLEGGIDLSQRNVGLARQAALEAGRDGLGRLRRALAHREQALTPDTPTPAATRPAVGRQEVSR